MQHKKQIPRFASEDEERTFWSDADSTDYVNWSNAEGVTFPDLSPSLRTISLRLSEIMLAELKELANKRDVPYQSLLKIFLAERIAAERHGSGRTRPLERTPQKRRR